MLITRRCTTATIAAAFLASPAAVRAAKVAELNVRLKPHTGDFDHILTLGVLRVLVPYSRTLFFEDKGDFHGVAAEVADELEKCVRRTTPTHKQRFVVVMIPTSRDHLIPDLLVGQGDVAVGDITITPERQKLVAFTTPTFAGVNELVVTAAGMPLMTSADDLSGKDIAARPTTSTHASLIVLNERLVATGRPPLNIVDVPPTLEVEDMMEMVTAGLLPAIPVEDWVANLWSPLIPGLLIHRSAVLRSGANLGWAARPDSPKLLAVLNAFLDKFGGTAQNRRDTATYYLKHVKRMQAATNQEEMQKFEATIAFFQKYGQQYGFDGLMLVAQGYQESRLDQSTRSTAGAVGLMQLLPATGRQMGVGSITQAESNVHAGAKYMRHLIDTYLKDTDFDEQNRTLFAFACYNAGPNKVSRLRNEAKAEGLNENVWFDNVERIAVRRIGQETARYVRNIYKYYIGYKLALETQQLRAAGKAQVTAAPAPGAAKPTFP
jgi:membrane-bound lytic murein transglycosylase MltF